jgi:hypothetical protein
VKNALLAGALLIAVAVFWNGPPSKETIERLDVPDSVKPVKQTIVALLKLLPESMQPTVDFSFSLECRDLESQWDKEILLPWDTAVVDWERKHPWPNELPNPWNVEHYDTGVRIAFNHGVPDGNSAFDVDNLRVVEVTPEGITLRGKTKAAASEEGFFDRRTGHGMIRWYRADSTDHGSQGEKLWKQFILECQPSKPAKF